MRKTIVQGAIGSLGHDICGHRGMCGVRIGFLGLQLAGLVKGSLAVGPLGTSLALGCCSKGLCPRLSLLIRGLCMLPISLRSTSSRKSALSLSFLHCPFLSHLPAPMGREGLTDSSGSPDLGSRG